MKRTVMALVLALSSSAGVAQEGGEADADAAAFRYKQCLNGTPPGEPQRDGFEATTEAERKAREDRCRAICDAWNQGRTEEEKQIMQTIINGLISLSDAQGVNKPENAHPDHQ